MNPDKEELSPKLARLRRLIQLEIDYSFQVENEYRFSHETRQSNDRAWKDFQVLFEPVGNDGEGDD